MRACDQACQPPSGGGASISSEGLLISLAIPGGDDAAFFSRSSFDEVNMIEVDGEGCVLDASSDALLSLMVMAGWGCFANSMLTMKSQSRLLSGEYFEREGKKKLGVYKVGR